MRILVVGNCQTLQVSEVLSTIPGYRVKRHAFKDLDERQQTFAYLKHFDAVITQDFNTALAPKFFSELNSHNKVVLFPRIILNGFHPDFSQLITIGGENELHSRLAIMAHGAGVSRDETVSLFNHEFFRRLGHFESFETHKLLTLKDLSRYIDSPDVLFDNWYASGVFFYQANHPHLRVTDDILRGILARHGLPLPDYKIHDLLSDPLAQFRNIPTVNHPMSRNQLLGGSARFKLGNKIMVLDEYIETVHDSLSKRHERSIQKRGVSEVDQADFEKTLNDYRASRSKTYAVNPYSGRPSRNFWSDLLVKPEPQDVTPTAKLRPLVNAHTKVATAGSCFAQHIAKTMLREGLDYFVAETGPADLSPETRNELGYGLFSARYGNIYTARQLLQLLQRSMGDFKSSHSAWQARKGDGWVDPFRPNIGETFATPEDVEADRTQHLGAVRHMFETTDIFVFTMGLTECWVDEDDGSAFPVAPGVVAQGVDAQRIGFRNFGFEETRHDMVEFLTRLRRINPNVQVILTVSPVPLIATWSANDVLTATTYSKSVLRAVAGDLSELFEQVHYFPSYEIITGAFNRGRYFEEDLRSVRPEGVNHVMRVFLDTLLVKEDDPTVKQDSIVTIKPDAERAFLAQQGIVCDEELIVRNRTESR